MERRVVNKQRNSRKRIIEHADKESATISRDNYIPEAHRQLNIIENKIKAILSDNC